MSYNSKLTNEIVRQIRQSTKKSSTIARDFKVSPAVIFRVRNRTGWRHVP